ncbi:hypothetical protein LOCC1_G004312 [Lachnellula occidentalis]|uniref:Uncharacterized protein n=1 Tax=Lachnellula occidentalis TaxID=215460 RepID=A0A8H8UDK4_9HELO|nr:hypothetical protein LOCC1_G004312 [Lachnellula occidentalis]
MSAFPPHKSIPSIPVSQEIALKYLSSYLTSTSTKAHLLPNARLEASGPTAGSSSSVTLHNLQRVEAGLKGEWLAPTLQLNEGDGEGIDVEIAGQGMDDGTAVAEEGWQDLEEYQREQSIEVGDVGNRDASRAVDSGRDGELEAEAAGDDSEVDVEAPKAKKVKTKHESAHKVSKSIDKDARKMEKKARLMEEKKQRAAEKLKKAEA